MSYHPKYPKGAAETQATWLAKTLGPGWEGKVDYALVPRGVATTDSNVYTFWAERGNLSVYPVQSTDPWREYKDEDLALLAAEVLDYTCRISPGSLKWKRWSLPLAPTRDPRKAVSSHLAALSAQIIEHQTMLNRALATLNEDTT